MQQFINIVHGKISLIALSSFYSVLLRLCFLE